MANGKQGEALFKQLMESIGYKVEDVSNDSNYWYKDIDFFVTSPVTNLTKSFECKWDSRINTTGNLYLELTNVHSKGGRGWYEFCEADYLAYGNAQIGVFYIIPFAALKERVATLKLRTASCGQDSTGLILPLSKIEDLVQLL